MGKRPDLFSGRLEFPGDEPQNPNVPELLQPHVGGKPGELIDGDRNIYDATGRQIGEEYTDEELGWHDRALKMVQKERPGENVDLHNEKVEFYYRQIRHNAQEAKTASTEVSLKKRQANDRESGD